MDLKSQVILVTGGGSGIGLELARQLVVLGNSVIICRRFADRLAQAERATCAQALNGDVTSHDDQNRMSSDVQAQHGQRDLPIDTAAILRANDFGNDPETLTNIQRESAANAIAPLTPARHALPLPKTRAQPGVLIIGSGVDCVPSPGTPVCSGTKALIHHCAHALRHQLQPHGITVSKAMSPVVDTDMAKALTSGSFSMLKPADLVRDILVGLRRNLTEMSLGQLRQIKLMGRIALDFLFARCAKTEFH